MSKYKEIKCDTALNKLKRKIPYGWDLNIYRGCEHGCKYCFAMYSHSYLNSNNYFGEVFVKTNIIEKLEMELKSSTWKKDIINIGGVTDSYQQTEKEYKLMPEILKLLIKYKNPAIISTKSNLILRDYDLIDELSRITYINIASTITTMDENLRKLIEPNASTSKERFEALKLFRNTNASVGLHVMPIIPYLTDNYENLNSLCENAKECNVHYLLPGTLYLRGETRKVFLEFIRTKFPKHYVNLCRTYKTGAADNEYKNNLYSMLNNIRDKYSLSSSYSTLIKEKLK